MNDDEQVQLRLPVNADASALFSAAVHAMLARTEFVTNPDQLTAEITEAAQTALANAREGNDAGANGPIAATLTVVHAPRRFVVDIDQTWRFETALPAIPPQNQTAESADEIAMSMDTGVGLLLIRQLADEVDYIPAPGNNRWRLTKLLPSEEQLAVSAGDTLEVSLNLPASYRYLNIISDCISVMLDAVDGTDASPIVHEVKLATQELCTNIVAHAYRGEAGRIDVKLMLSSDSRAMVVETVDQGPGIFELARVGDTQAVAPAARSNLISGSALLFASATLVNAGNYLFNLLLGRWLGPAAFADLSLIVTLFLMTSFLTAGFQTPAARFSALFTADEDLAGVANLRRWLSWFSGGFGVGLVLLFVVGAPLWSRFFSTTSMAPFVIFGLFVPFYLLQGVDRGILQGRTKFRWLAVTYQVEMWSRLVLSMAFVAVGWAVNGAVLGIGLSFVAAWLIARQVRTDLPRAHPLTPQLRREVLVFVGPVLIAQLGQILINNSDILIVRRFFPAEIAGYYAALALTGRIVFFATWSVVTAMFPIVAQRYQRGESHRNLLFASLGIVVTISLVIITGLYLFPELIVQILFGSAYLSIAPLLWLYALATMFYALANVVINYRLSIGNVGGTYMAIAAGVTQVGLLWVFHDSLAQVVMIQVGLMFTLFILLLGWDFARTIREQAQRKSL